MTSEECRRAARPGFAFCESSSTSSRITPNALLKQASAVVCYLAGAEGMQWGTVGHCTYWHSLPRCLKYVLLPFVAGVNL